MRAIIDDATGLFTLINTFTVTPQDQDAVVRSSAWLHRAACAVPARVHRRLGPREPRRTSRCQLRAVGEHHADLAAMMATAPAKAHVTEVGALADHVDPVVYRVAFVGSRERAAQ